MFVSSPDLASTGLPDATWSGSARRELLRSFPIPSTWVGAESGVRPPRLQIGRPLVFPTRRQSKPLLHI